MRTVSQWTRSLPAALLLGALLLPIAGGCESTGKSAVPAGADRVATSKGGRVMTYDAGRSGKIYLLDTTKNKMVFSNQVRDGDRVSVDPERDRIEINDRTASEQRLNRDHDYKLYFHR